MPSTFNPPMSVGEFARNNCLVMRCDPTRPTKRQADSEWHNRASHWVCIFTIGSAGARRRRFLTRFSRGSALSGPPSRDEVLSCLARQCADLERAGYEFDAWREEAGYNDPEDKPRDVRRIFNSVATEARHLRDFLGDSVFSALLHEVDAD